MNSVLDRLNSGRLHRSRARIVLLLGLLEGVEGRKERNEPHPRLGGDLARERNVVVLGVARSGQLLPPQNHATLLQRSYTEHILHNFIICSFKYKHSSLIITKCS